MTRADAFQHVVNVMNELALDEIQYDTLRRAIVEYGHATASETLAAAKAAIEECLS